MTLELKSNRDCLQALLNGFNIQRDNWPKDQFLYMKDGTVYFSDGTEARIFTFCNKDGTKIKWIIRKDPPKLYSFVEATKLGKPITRQKWSSGKVTFNNKGLLQIERNSKSGLVNYVPNMEDIQSNDWICLE